MFPSAWIEALFSRLTVRYGAAFARQWEGLDIAAVKADWQDVMAGMERHPDAIRHALDTLPPDKPPNAMQFRDACRRAPQPVQPALPRPDEDPEIGRKALEEIRAAQQESTMRPAERCVRNILERGKARPLTQAQKAMLESCRPQVGEPLERWGQWLAGMP